MTTQPARSPSSSASADAQHTDLANAIRVLAMDAVEQANSGHPGMPMGMADVATVLYRHFLNFNPAQPHWPDRDRLILSAGHGSMLLYALMFLTGYDDISLDELKRFRQMGAKTAGHPEFGHAAGIETTTGPLGQGIANAVGIALAERMFAARFGEEISNHYTYVIAGDGCLMEGISHEAMSLAGHLKLGKLIVLFDDNGISIDGPTSLAVSDDTRKRAESYGWNAASVDGHDAAAIKAAIEAARASAKPTLIACRTTIGYGAPTKGGTAATHGSPLGKSEITGTREKLNWPHEPFHIPEQTLNAWRETAARGKALHRQWQQRLDTLEASKRSEYERILSKELPASWAQAVDDYKKKLAESKPNEATRKSSQNALEVLNAHIPELIGGSADLTGSNNTKTGGLTPIAPGNYAGRYLYYGVREHGMAAAMNGLALSGFIPYGGTFLVFSDYCRPSIRLSALMQQQAIYVMTHDSIGLGEDGPTHQPIEHLASLRAMPGLLVFRPADATETLECWALAVATRNAPSLLALSRQNLPTVRTSYEKENKCARGGYVLAENTDARVTLIATGSEVHIALAASKLLTDKGIASRVVSMPCTELFDAQAPAYRTQTLRPDTLRVSIEAASPYGWERYTGENGLNIGIPGFGASAPAEELYRHFGLTPETIAEKIIHRMQG